jgi:hypothetical protein
MLCKNSMTVTGAKQKCNNLCKKEIIDDFHAFNYNVNATDDISELWCNVSNSSLKFANLKLKFGLKVRVTLFDDWKAHMRWQNKSRLEFYDTINR